MHTPSRASNTLWSFGTSTTPTGSPHADRRSLFDSTASVSPVTPMLPHPFHTPAFNLSTSFPFSTFWPGTSTSTTPSRKYKPTEPLGPTPVPSRASSSGPAYGIGYLAFPPSGPSSEAQVLPRVTENDAAEAERCQREREQEQEEEQVRIAAAEREAQVRARAEQARLEAEVEARRGEEAWVRSGGVLRDARGMRDVARTEAVRAELKLREWEEGVRARWEGYERGWRALLGGAAGGREVRFGDIPWPVARKGDGEEVELGDLTVGTAEEFILEGLKVRGCKVMRKERVRSSLLRWHPDKMTGVLARVVEEDVERVREGIRVVTECLQALNART